jgi:hypothetical protein
MSDSKQELKDESKMSDEECRLAMIKELNEMPKEQMIEQHIKMISQTSLLYQFLTKTKQDQLVNVQKLMSYVPQKIQDDNKEAFLTFYKMYKCAGCMCSFKQDDQYHVAVDGTIV